MAIETIRKGQKPSEKVYTATCRSCASLFRFTASDINTFPDQRDPERFIKCQVCDAYIYEASFVPVAFKGGPTENRFGYDQR